MHDQLVSNPHGHPMIHVDQFVFSETGQFYIGKRYITKHDLREQIYPLSLLVESMGQTVEFNIRNLLLEGEMKTQKLLFGGFSEIMYHATIDKPLEMVIIVKKLLKFSNFFTSEAVIENTDGSLQYVSGKLVHAF